MENSFSVPGAKQDEQLAEVPAMATEEASAPVAPMPAQAPAPEEPSVDLIGTPDAPETDQAPDPATVKIGAKTLGDLAPDFAASMDELSKITGVPFGLTAKAPEMAKKAADQIEIDDALSQGGPSTKAFLADPKNATIARGGMKELTEIEKFLSKYEGFSTFGKGFEIGQMQTDLAAMAKPLLDAEEGKMDMGLLARVQAKAAEIGALQQQSTDEGWLGTTIGTGFGQQVGQIGAMLQSAGVFGLGYLAASVAATLATRGRFNPMSGFGPAATEGVAQLDALGNAIKSSKSLSDLRNSMRLGGAFGSVSKGYELESVLAFTEYLSEGIPEAEARGAALAVGALNTVVESATDVMLISGTDFGRRLLFGSAVDKKTLIKTLLKTEGFKKAAIEFGKRGIVGSLVNGIEEGIQEIVGISGKQVAQAVSGTDVQGKEYKEFSLPEAATQVGQAVVAGGVSGGALVTAGNAPSLLADMRSARTANFRESFFKAADKLNASKVAARSKDAAVNFFNRVSKDKGVQKIEIPREQFDGFFQSAGVDAKDIPEIASSLGIKNYAESQATGVELEIDAGDFATKIASNSEMFDAMKGHVRINGAMTATEELSIRQQNEKVLTDILEGLRKDGTLDESSPEFTDLKNRFTEEFVKQGQSRAVAEKNAEANATMMYVLAANDNKTLKEIDPAFPLEIKNPDMKQADRPRVDVSVDPYLDALRTGQYPESKPTGDTIIQAIRRLSGGGVAPMAEMSDMDSKKVPVQSGGRGLDQVLGELVGEGYISEGDGVNEVLDLIKEEIAGNPTYSMAASGELSQADLFKQNADTIAKYLTKLGIDVNAVTDNAEVRRLITEREQAAGMVNVDGRMVDPNTGLDASGEFALFQGEKTVEVDGVQRPVLNSEGRPIHTTKEGIENFWRWFGDSKVVDEQGRPKVVYHGTPKNFEAFKEGVGWQGFGFHLGTPQAASEVLEQQRNQTTGSAGSIIPAYLSVKNPIDFDASYDRGRHDPSDIYQMIMRKAEEEGVPGITDDEVFDFLDDKHEFNGKKFIELEGQELRDQIRDWLGSIGFDGITYVNAGEDVGSASWIAFVPTQIKSSIGNTGAFSANDPRILYQGIEQIILERIKKEARARPKTKLQSVIINALDAIGIDWSSYRPDYVSTEFGKIRISDHAQVEGGGFNMGTGERSGESDVSLFNDNGKIVLQRFNLDLDSIESVQDLEKIQKLYEFFFYLSQSNYKNVSAKTKPEKIIEIAEKSINALNESKEERRKARLGGYDLNLISDLEGNASRLAEENKKIKKAIDEKSFVVKKSGSGKTFYLYPSQDEASKTYNSYAILTSSEKIDQENAEAIALEVLSKNEKTINESLQKAEKIDSKTISSLSRPKRIIEKRAMEIEEDGKKAPGILYQSKSYAALGFNSKLVQTIEQKMGGAATADQIRGLLKDVKQEEKDWLGIEDLLKTKNKFTKKEVLEYLAANDLGIEEISLRDNVPTTGEAEKMLLDRGYDLDENMDGDIVYIDSEGRQVGFQDLPRDIREAINGVTPPTKFSRYTLGGGKNYREVLFTVQIDPNKASDMAARQAAYNNHKNKPRIDEIDRLLLDPRTENSSALFDEKRRLSNEIEDDVDKVYVPKQRNNFKSSHFNQENIFAHTRLNDRVDADGKKVLFIEEIQSDWHQAGRKKGYSSKLDLSQWRAEESSVLKGSYDVYDQDGNQTVGVWGGKTPEDAVRLAAETISGRLVPDAPFKKTWHEFVMKRVIRMAAEQGYDRVAWTTGEQQADRYDLSKQISEVHYSGSNLKAYDLNGKTVLSETGVMESDLESYIGKEAAKKLLEQPKQGTLRSLVGQDLKVGGEGMKGFYDKILVNFANSFGKKFGAKVESTTLKTPSDATSEDVQLLDDLGVEGTAKEQATVHSLDITPALKESAIKDGFPLFQGRESARGAITINQDMAATLLLFKNHDESTVPHELGHRYLEILSYLARQDGSTQVTRDQDKRVKDWLKDFGMKGKHIEALKAELEMVKKDQTGDYRFKAASTSLTNADQLVTKRREELENAKATGSNRLIQQALEKLEKAKRKQEARKAAVESASFDYGDRAKKIEQAISMFEAGGEEFLTTFLSDLGWSVEDKEMRSIMITPFHELFAETHERYLMEGKAPASWLRDLFNSFNAWLTNLYRRKVKPGVEITPELEEIFKRMYVAESELEVAAKEIPSDPIFMTAEEAGLSPEEFEVYVKETRDALAQAKARMVSTMIQEANRENKRWWKARRAELEEEIRKQVEAQPEYVISDSIKAGVTDQDVRIKKINEQSIIEAVGPAFYETIKDRMKPYVAQKGGMALDRVAFAFDIVNPDQLVSILSNLQDKESVINNAVDVKMVERYGDIQADGVTYDKAIESLNNEEREKMIDRERQIIHAKAKSVKPFIDAKNRAENRMAREAAATIPTKEQIKQTVEKKISTMALRELSPGKYLRASLKASADAVQFVRQKDFTAAAEAKTRQLLNHYMYVQSKEALSFGEKLTRYARKFEEKNIRKRFVKHSPQALAQIDEVLDKYSFKTITFKKIDRLKQLFEFLRDAGEASGRDFISDIPPELISLSEKRNYRDIPLDDLRVIKTVLERLDHQNRLKTKLKDGREAEEFKEKIGEMVNHIRENADAVIPVNDQMRSNNSFEKLKKLIKGLNLSTKKLHSLIYKVEGYKGSKDSELGVTGGPVWDALFKPYVQAAAKKATMETDASVKLSKILGEFFKRHKGFTKSKIRFSTIPGRTFSIENILAVALNSGNDGNMQRLLSGEGWSYSQHKEIIDYLGAEDWKTVQDIWDFMEQYRPMLDAHEKRLLGNEMEFVKPVSFMTKYGKVRGGYYPITYDPGRSAMAAEFEDVSAAQAMMEGARGASKPTDGFKKNRVDAVRGRPVMLTIDGVFRGTTDVIHYLTHFEYVLNANRILNNRRFADAVKDHYGIDHLKKMKDAVKAIATNGDPGSRDAWLKVLAHARAGIGISSLGFNLWNALQNYSGISNSFVKVGYGYMIKNVGKFTKNPIEATRFAHEKSEVMRNRAKTQNRTIGEIMNNMDKTKAVNEKIKMISMLPNYMTQMAVDVPTWNAAYEKFEDENGILDSEQEANAVAYADQAVLDSQGSGFMGMLSSVERAEGMKILTMFYSYFNTVLNMSMEVTGRTNFKDPVSVLMAVRDYMTLWLVPTMYTVGLRALLSNKDEDEEDLAKMLVNEQISYMAGTLPLVRELTGGLQYMAGTKDYGSYGGPASLRFLSEFEKFAKGATKEDISASVAKAGVMLGGVVLHLPTGQAIKTVEGAVSIMNGDAGPTALIVGKPPKK